MCIYGKMFSYELHLILRDQAIYQSHLWFIKHFVTTLTSEITIYNMQF